MVDKIRDYVEGIFENAPESRKAYELREEMIQNLVDKYNDLVAEGKPIDVAYNIAVGSVGDVSELFEDLEDGFMRQQIDPKAQKKSAILTAIAVMMYILSVIPPILISEYADRFTTIGVLLMFLMIAGATGLLIYNNMTKPRYLKSNDSMVEEFREFQSKRSGRKQMYGAINGAIWSLIIALYFIISFMTMAWHITWVIFLIGGAVSSLLRIFIATHD